MEDETKSGDFIHKHTTLPIFSRIKPTQNINNKEIWVSSHEDKRIWFISKTKHNPIIGKICIINERK